MKINQIKLHSVEYGKNVKVIEPCNLYECRLGSNVFIGPFVEVQRGATIGNRTKVQSHSFICEFVKIGNDCFIGHSVCFINDKFKDGGPANGDKTKWESTEIGNHVSFGSNATILPVKICDRVVIGAGSVVTKDITKSGVYVGNPAVYLREL